MEADENTLVGQLVSDIWWLVLLRGIVAVLLGISLFTNTAATLAVIIVFLGIYWLVDGIFTLLASFTGRKVYENWGWGIFSGVVSILAGLAILAHPVLTTLFSASFIASIAGIMIVLSGVSSIVIGFRFRKTSGEWMMIIGGVLTSLLGLSLLMNPLFSALVFVYILATFALIGGIVMIALAFKIKKLKNEIS